MERCRVSAESERMLTLGHPWIIQDQETKRWKRLQTGSIIELTAPDGRYLATALYDPDDRIIARVLSYDRTMRLNAHWLEKQCAAAIRRRTLLAGDSQTTAYRLINGEGDALPGLTVDRYGDFLMLQLYSEAWRPHLPLVTQILGKLVKPAGIYEKRRPRDTRTLEQRVGSKQYGVHIHGEHVPTPHVVTEHGIRYQVNLAEGLDTGLFLDQRENRSALMRHLPGKQFLNLFAYTGAFSLAAASVGATHCTSVDISPRYMAIHRQNILLNNLPEENFSLIIDDCLAALTNFREQGRSFDVIMLDPPSFSTTGKGMFTTRKGTSELVAAALNVLTDDGLLVCSSNHQKTDLADYLKELRRGALQADSLLTVIAQAGQPLDFPYPVTFPEGRYLKYIITQKQQRP